MTTISTAEILDKGINCLLEKLGTVETERFISVIIRENPITQNGGDNILTP